MVVVVIIVLAILFFSSGDFLSEPSEQGTSDAVFRLGLVATVTDFNCFSNPNFLRATVDGVLFDFNVEDWTDISSTELEISNPAWTGTLGDTVVVTIEAEDSPGAVTRAFFHEFDGERLTHTVDGC